VSFKAFLARKSTARLKRVCRTSDFERWPVPESYITTGVVVPAAFILLVACNPLSDPAYDVAKNSRCESARATISCSMATVMRLYAEQKKKKKEKWKKKKNKASVRPSISGTAGIRIEIDDASRCFGSSSIDREQGDR